MGSWLAEHPTPLFVIFGEARNKRDLRPGFKHVWILLSQRRENQSEIESLASPRKLSGLGCSFASLRMTMMLENFRRKTGVHRAKFARLNNNEESILFRYPYNRLVRQPELSQARLHERSILE